MQKDYSNEAILVVAINQNDQQAWDYLQRQCYAPVRHYVTMSQGSEEDAKDMLSEGLAGLVEKVSKEKLVMTAKVSTLLISMAKNQWKDVLKGRDTQRRNVGKLRDAPGFTREEKMDRAVFWDVAQKCFSQLEEQCQKILLMIDEEKEHKEIGALLGLSTEYIKKRNYLCHKEWVRIVQSHPGYLNPGSHIMGE